MLLGTRPDAGHLGLVHWCYIRIVESSSADSVVIPRCFMDDFRCVDEKFSNGETAVSMDHVQDVVFVLVEESITFPTLAVLTVFLTRPTRQPIRGCM